MDRRFPKHEADEATFWDLRYRERFTPWDAGSVPRRLRDWLAAHPPSGRALVPGCGTGYEVRALAEARWDVDGIDFSEAAIAAAQEALGPAAARVRFADFFGPEVAGPY